MLPSARPTARQTALAALRERRQRRAGQEKQIEAAVYDLTYALAQRDQAISEADAKAAVAVHRLVDLGLTQTEVVANTGGVLSLRDVGRLLAGTAARPGNDSGR